MKNDIRSTIQRVAGAVTAGLLLVAGVQQMRAGQQTRSAAHPPDWTNKVIEEKIWKLLEDHKSEEHTSELQSHHDLVCRLLLEKKKKKRHKTSLRTRRTT